MIGATPTTSRMFEAVAAQLKPVKIAIDVKTTSSTGELLDAINAGQVAATDLPMTLTSMYFFYNQNWSPTAILNGLREDDPELAGLVATAAAMPVNQSEQAWVDVSIYIVDNAYTVPIVATPQRYVAQKNIGGLDINLVTAYLIPADVAVNSVVIVVGTQLNSVLIGRVSLRSIMIVAAFVGTAGAIFMTTAAALGAPLLVVLAGLALVPLTFGPLTANLSAVALAPFVKGSGAAAALLGTAQSLIGAVIPPLTALIGTTAVVMGATMSGGLLIALIIVLVLARRPGALSAHAPTIAEQAPIEPSRAHAPPSPA
ncbi:hypothetical protein [Microbacterium sp.]|uniref:hypothetical protein n=1 Tax=Microbacterium sp. TaxID=51671 RepID=UPI003A855B39